MKHLNCCREGGTVRAVACTKQRSPGSIPPCQQDVLTTALEAGLCPSLLFPEGAAARAAEWQRLGRFTPLTRAAGGEVLDAGGAQVR